jgi:peptidoglycan/LPS O-acetylase OafA/YrhL
MARRLCKRARSFAQVHRSAVTAENGRMTPRFVQRLGLALVAAGLVVGGAACVSASSIDDADPVAEQREMRALERLGGTASVQTERFDQWMSSLWHGRRLGFTLAVLGLLVGGACWHVGGLMAEDGDD